MNRPLWAQAALTRRGTYVFITRRGTSVQICTLGDYRRSSFLNLKKNGFINKIEFSID